MTWEYPYRSGQAQEYLSDRLVRASLYGLKVTRPSYCSADDKPATTAEAQVAFDSGRGFVDHVCENGRESARRSSGASWTGPPPGSPVCTQLECTVAGGHELLFATLEQWAGHWNSFHEAAAPAFNCMMQAVPMGRAPHQTHLISCFATFKITTHTSMMGAGGRI